MKSNQASATKSPCDGALSFMAHSDEQSRMGCVSSGTPPAGMGSRSRRWAHRRQAANVGCVVRLSTANKPGAIAADDSSRTRSDTIENRNEGQRKKPAKFAARRASMKMRGYPVNFHSPAKEDFIIALLWPCLAQRQGFVDPPVSLFRHVSISACALAE